MRIVQRLFPVVHDEEGLSGPMVGFDDAAVWKFIPGQCSAVGGPMIQLSQSTYAFCSNDLTGTILVLHVNQQRVPVLQTPFQLHLTVMVRFGRVEAMMRLCPAGNQTLHGGWKVPLLKKKPIAPFVVVRRKVQIGADA